MPFPGFDECAAVEADYPIYPLNAPGMPLPGPDFCSVVEALGDGELVIEGKGKSKQVVQYGAYLDYLTRKALYDPEFAMPIRVKGSAIVAPFVVGHLWGGEAAGPCAAEVMVIGKHPGADEVAQRRNFVGPASQDFYRALDELQVPAETTDGWYITNLVKHNKLDPASGTLAATWINNCLPLLHQELRLIRPKYVLCLGSDAGKGVLGTKGSVGNMLGQVIDFTFPVHMPGEPEELHTAKLMVITHPAAVFHNPEQYDNLLHGLGQFIQLTNGHDVGRVETDIDHRNVYTERHLASIVDRILADPDPASRIIAVDCEWEGTIPEDPDSYLRTVQFSHKAKHAYCVVLRHQGGGECFSPSLDRAYFHLRRLLVSTPERQVRVGGHFFGSDLPWLMSIDIDLRGQYLPAITGNETEEAELTRTEGGWDTGAMAHAHCETGNFELETLGVRFTTVPRYDLELSKWKVEYCKERKISQKQMTGYGAVPDEILHYYCSTVKPSYANYDVDTTRRLFDVYNGVNGQSGLLDSDRYGLSSRRAYLITMKSRIGFLEMERNGIAVDRSRGDELTRLYMAAEAQNTAELRAMVGWEAFNPRSDFQCRELLYGVRYNGKKNKETGLPERITPPNVQLYNLTPIKAAGKPPKAWDKVVRDKQEHLYNPACDKETLGIIGRENPVVWKIRDVRFLRQILVSTLRRPTVDKQTAVPILDEDGFMAYEAGLLSFVDFDERIRTHFYPVETGRCSSSRPPLQNLCFDAQTEVLTSVGWIPAVRLTARHRVAQYWPETKAIDFVRPTSVIQQHHKGTMLRITTKKQIDLCLTPQHRCLFRNRKTGRLFEKPAVEFAGDCQHIQAGVFAGGPESLSWAQVAWLCAVQADGHYVTGGGIQFGLKKPRKIRRLTRCLKRLGVDYTLSVNSRGATVFYIGANAPVVTEAKQLMPDRQFDEFLLNYDRETLDLFCAELTHWDGLYERATEYSSSDKANADWAQILWTLSGVRARMRLYRPANPNARDHYCVDIPGKQRDYSLTKNPRVEEIPWDDTVYCVTVPSSFIVVRRNGKVSVTGNSKRREDDYSRILGSCYKYPIRSMLRATPGRVLVECDLKSAEIATMAWMSGDPTMAEHVRRNMLPEDHPDYLDIHSNMAVNAFHLTCPPTKKGLADAGKKGLRVAAKNVVFGIPYQRGAEAIQRQCLEENAKVSIEEAEQLKQGYFDTYPLTQPFLEICKERVSDPGFLVGAYGRPRRFSHTDDRSVLANMEREACNCLIQNGVADNLSLAIFNLQQYRDNGTHGDRWFDMLLQIHDALVFEVDVEHLEWLIEEVIPTCINVPFWPCHPDGTPHEREEPYYFGVDTEIFVYWGVKIPADEGHAMGIPDKYLHG